MKKSNKRRRKKKSICARICSRKSKKQMKVFPSDEDNDAELDNVSVNSLEDSKFLRKKKELRKKDYYSMEINKAGKKKDKGEESKENDYLLVPQENGEDHLLEKIDIEMVQSQNLGENMKQF